jgi:hypothetical protein
MKKYLLFTIYYFYLFIGYAQKNEIPTSPSSVFSGTGIFAAGDRKLTIVHEGSDGALIRSTASYSAVDIDAINGDAALRFYKAGVGKWNIRNNPSVDDLEFFELDGGGQRMLLKSGTGNLGIGTSSPIDKLDVSGNAVLSKSGAGFGSRSLQFYSDQGTANEWRPGYVASGDNGTFTGRLDFFTNGTTSANKTGSLLGMSVVNGRVGVGSSAANSPDFPLHVTSTSLISSSNTGAFAIGSTVGAHLNFDNNEINAWTGTTGSTLFLNYWSNAKVQIGNGSTGNLDVNGFSNLGDGAPAIKMKKLMGTANALSGGVVDIPHGLTTDKILDVSVLVASDPNQAVGPEYTNVPSWNYKVFITSTNVRIFNGSGATQIYGKPIRILITYEE